VFVRVHLWFIEQPDTMLYRTIAIALLLLFIGGPAHAIPSLIPLIPIIGVLIVKGAMLIGAFFFFMLSLYQENKKHFFIWGIVLFALFIVMMIFF
jgi:hypothetical protein